MLTKSLSLEQVFLSKMSKELDSIHIDQNKVGKGWSLAAIYTGFMVMVSRILVLGFGVYYVIDGSLSFTNLFIIFSYIGWIYFPLGAMIDKFEKVIKDITSVKELHEQVESVKMESLNIGKNIKNPQGNISFNKVSFEYIEGKKVLRDISFDIQPGQRVAFVGNTGAGKSTIVNLMLRFWDIEKGSITLDGTNLKEIKKSSLRSHIGVVSQDNSLFNLTIKENLLFAKPKATSKELEQALKQAQAHFVFDLAKGLSTVIGERGLKLSGGEKQRLSIARLFLKNPQILILDEATSALDNKTEKLVQKALDTLMKGRTSIIIAHRLSTIQHADMIYMLENGKIVESGNYDTLMKQQKKFYELANPDHLIIN
ncbi:ATP-binding cassette domain-containing protein [Candidatus Gracilibacteria bacterium]|nr:ATP-binding cassette domain-containing protein [Candidatus Gracilibacteria bacterium]